MVSFFPFLSLFFVFFSSFYHLCSSSKILTSTKMAEISDTKEVEEVEGRVKERKEEEATSKDRLRPPSNPVRVSAASNAFVFWAYLALLVSLIALLASLLFLATRSTVSSGSAGHRRHSWFLSLPDDLRRHYSSGKLIKALTASAAPTEVFAIESGPRDGDAVLLLHGLGCSSFSFRRVLRSLAADGLRAVAIDLPGSGFSDRLKENVGGWGGILGGIHDIFTEIKEKGIFWGFDQLVETGGIPYEETRAGKPRNEGIGTTSQYGPAEIARILGQVIDSMGLAPVHLVLHDSALDSGINLATMNPEFVRSLTLIDPATQLPAFPWGILGAPVIAPILLRSRFLFSRLLQMCCSRSIDKSIAEAYRLFLRENDGRKAVIEVGNGMNLSFDLGEWMQSVVAEKLQVQVLWSKMWSDRWINEAKQVSAAIPNTKFTYHSGGRWPQEDAADEISNLIIHFATSFPKLAKEIKEEPLLKHIEEKILEASYDHYGHHHHPYGHNQEPLAAGYAAINHPYDHDHEPVAGHADMYGLG